MTYYTPVARDILWRVGEVCLISSRQVRLILRPQGAVLPGVVVFMMAARLPAGRGGRCGGLDRRR